MDEWCTNKVTKKLKDQEFDFFIRPSFLSGVALVLIFNNI